MSVDAGIVRCTCMWAAEVPQDTRPTVWDPIARPLAIEIDRRIADEDGDDIVPLRGALRRPDRASPTEVWAAVEACFPEIAEAVTDDTAREWFADSLALWVAEFRQLREAESRLARVR